MDQYTIEVEELPDPPKLEKKLSALTQISKIKFQGRVKPVRPIGLDP